MYWNLSDKDRLIKAFELADSPDLIKLFLEDIFTQREFNAATMRLRAICMLNDGATYEQIGKATNLSSRTISRLVKKYNQDGGFRKIIKKFKKFGKPYFD